MADELLDGQGACPVIEEQGLEGVPEVVESDLADPGPLYGVGPRNIPPTPGPGAADLLTTGSRLGLFLLLLPPRQSDDLEPYSLQPP